MNNACNYCTDGTCWACEIEAEAIRSGYWPQHSTGRKYPFPGYMNLLSMLKNAVKNKTGQEKIKIALVIQGEHEDEFTFISSVPSGEGRLSGTDMLVRAAQESLQHIREHDDFDGNLPTLAERKLDDGR